ncbi:hypothetical protein AMTR_s05592p00004270 [Amborella trichopoda]|uniref:Uncharacterized protein n=1 Tax=Amborella trichopoda TaxID=13333 RepID=U5CKU6_AMBTC|nr:hypothetical protein AMTR_s05592p00004270 [Amborella trichopoda]
MIPSVHLSDIHKVKLLQEAPASNDDVNQSKIVDRRSRDLEQVNEINSLGMVSQGEGIVWYSTITEPVLKSIPVNEVLSLRTGKVLNSWAIYKKLLGMGHNFSMVLVPDSLGISLIKVLFKAAFAEEISFRFH